MKVLSIVIMLIGAVAGLGELGYTKYFAGEKRAEGVLFDHSGPFTPVELVVTQEDLPVRVNMNVYGNLDYTALAPIGLIEIGNSISGEGNRIEFYAGANKNDVIEDAKFRTGNVTLNLSDRPTLSKKSILFDAATVGNWSLSMKPLREQDYKFDRITGTVYVKSKAVNWLIAGPGLFLMIGGMIMLIAIVKSGNLKA